MSRKVTVEITHANGSIITRELDELHAERLLMNPRTGWRLPKDSEFEKEPNGNIVKPRSSRKAKKDE